MTAASAPAVETILRDDDRPLMGAHPVPPPPVLVPGSRPVHRRGRGRRDIVRAFVKAALSRRGTGAIVRARRAGTSGRHHVRGLA